MRFPGNSSEWKEVKEEQMKFAYFGYRKWAFDITEKLFQKGEQFDMFTIHNTEYPNEAMNPLVLDSDVAIISSIQIINPKDVGQMNLKDYSALFFYGWSWLVPKNVTDNFHCVCCHPSPLPRYRGGTPMQHQIINGEEESAVTLFRMNQEMDSGDIYYQKSFSLEGNLNEIYSKVSEVSAELTLNLLNDFRKGTVKLYPQEGTPTIYKRRTPEMSEIKISDLETMTSKQIHDKIRALQSPYPNAYIKDKDGKKVYLLDSRTE
jgi:methionyl-tRNA formyltransferase